MAYKRYTHTDGIGAIGIVVIVALLIVGGAVAYEVTTRDRAAVEVDNETMLDTESDLQIEASVAAELRSLKGRTLALIGDLREEFNATGAVDMTGDVFANVKADIARLYAETHGAARVELDELRARIAAVEAQFESGADAGAEAVNEAVAEIIADIQASIQVDVDETTSTESEDEMDEDAEANSAEAAVEAEATVELETE